MSTVGLIASNETKGNNKTSFFAKNQKLMMAAGAIGCIFLVSAFLPDDPATNTDDGLRGFQKAVQVVEGEEPVLDFLELEPEPVLDMQAKEVDLEPLLLDLSAFDHCPSVDPVVPMPKDEWTTKPIWFPHFHHSMPEHLDEKLVNPITRTVSGAKDFYTSAPGLHQCVSDTQTVTCNNIHPKVDMDIDSQYDNFYSKYIFFVRNPMMAIPSSHNSKLNRFHSVVGQTPENDWQSVRDGWVKPMFVQWKNSIMAWRDSKYELGMYLIYEDLMDVNRGPKVLKNMAQLFDEAGFDTEQDEEAIKCIWYNSIGRENLLNHKKMLGHEYHEYIPGFREEHKDFFKKELDKFLKEIKGTDEVLETLLARYKSRIDLKIRIEV